MSTDSSKTESPEIPNGVAVKVAGVVQTVLAGFLLYLVPPTIASILIVVGLAAADPGAASRAQDWLQDSTSAQFIFVVLTEIIVIGLLILIMRFLKETWKTIAVKRPKLVSAGYALGGFVAYYVFYVAIAVLLYNYLDFEQRQEIGFSTDVMGVGLIMAFVSLVVLPPIVEEIIFRGFLYTRFRRFLPIGAAAVVVSILFSIAHLQIGSGNALLWVAALDTFILSLVLVYLREKTGNIWAGVGVHAMKNCLAFVILFKLVSLPV